MEPLFSIIIPIYGVEKYLNTCVDSILNQNFNDFEIILVDDGSKDNCPDICDEYAKKDNRIKVIHKNNGGLVSARKSGCEVASGKYIVNVDGDDWVKNGYFDAIASIVKKYEPDVICFGAIYSWKDRELEIPYYYKSKMYMKEDIESQIFPVLFEAKNGEYFPPSIWSKAVKRKLYTECQNNVDDRISIAEDVVCTRQIIYKAQSLYILNDCLYYYRQNEQSMTKNKKAFDMFTSEIIYNNFVELIGEDQQLELQVNRSICHIFFNMALSQFNRKDSYKKIVCEISEQLDKKYMKTILKNCHFNFKYYKGRIALLCLKYKLFFLMKTMNTIKNLF